VTVSAGQSIPLSLEAGDVSSASGPILGGSVPVYVLAVFSDGSEQLLASRQVNIN